MSNPLEILYTALHAEIGIVVSTEEPEALKAQINYLKKGRPEFAGLSVWRSPTQPESELWVGKSAPGPVETPNDRPIDEEL